MNHGLRTSIRFAQAVLLAQVVLSTQIAIAQQPIPIATIERSTPVSFEKEILPLLQKNCLACHSASEANGELVLESPTTMIRGGDSGPAIVAGKSDESLMLKLAAHQGDPQMPPPKNDVAAQALTSQQLGLLKLWIDQGADSAGLADVLSPKHWQPLPPGNQPIYAVDVSPDGQFAACGRANQIFIYHVPTGQLVTRLTDPSLQAATKDNRPGIAHLDVIHSLAFNAQGDMLASGGFRTAKLWRYPRDVQRATMTAEGEVRAVAVSPDASLVAVGEADGTIKLWPVIPRANAADVADGKQARDPPAILALTGHTAEIRSLCFTRNAQRLISASADKTIRVWSTEDGKLLGRIDSPDAVNAVATFLQTLPVPTDGQLEKAPATVELIVSGGADNLVRSWSIPEQLPQPVADAPAKTRVLAVSDDGQLIAMANAAGLVRVARADTNELVYQWQAHAGAIHDVAFAAAPAVAMAADDKQPNPPAEPLAPRIATAGADGTARLWQMKRVDAPGAMDSPDAPAELLVLRGSLAAINGVDVRADGKQLVSGSADGSVTVWNLEQEEAAAPSFFMPAMSVDGAPDSPHLAVVSPDGKLLATVGNSDDRPAILVADLASGKLLHTLLGHEAAVTSLAFSSDNLQIVSGSADKTARVWSLSDAKFPELAQFSEHAASVTSVAFSSNAQEVVTGSAAGEVKLWNVADSKELMDFAGHTGPIVAVAVPVGNQPISASADKTVRFWNPANGQATRTQTEAAAVTAMTLSRDGTRLAVATADRSVKIYQPAAGNLLLTMGELPHDIRSLSFSPDSLRLVGEGNRPAAPDQVATPDANSLADMLAMVWDMTDGRLLEIVASNDAAGHGSSQPPQPNAPQYVVTAATYGPAADQIVLTDNRANIRIHTLRFAAALRGMSQPITAVAYHPNGQLIVTACEDGTVRGYNVTDSQQVFSANHGAPVHSLAVSADGARMASGGEDKLVKLWNPANGAPLQPPQLAGFTAPVRTVCFSADGTRIIGGSGGELGELLVINVSTPTGFMEHAIVGHTGSVDTCAVLDAGGGALSAASDGSVLRWELLAVRQFAGHSQAVTSLAVLPPQDAQPPQVVSGSLDGTLRRWNTLTGLQIAQLNHGGPIASIAVRGDGQRLASASSNNTLRLWNAANNQQLAEMRGDLKAKSLLANLTRQKTDATAKLGEATAALKAAEDDLPVKTAAEKTAAAALAVTTKDVESKAAAMVVVSTAKSDAERLAIQAAATAQKAAQVMEIANQLAVEQTGVALALADKAARASAVASADPDNATLAKMAADATTLASAAEAQAKAAEAAKATPTKVAADMAQAAATVAQTALATNKPFSDAATALAQSQATQQAASQTHSFAMRDLQQATTAVPAAKNNLAESEALLKQVDVELAAAVKAETDAQLPVRCVTFSPDGRTLASGGDFGVVHTWDAETGQAVSSYAGHSAPISALAYLSNEAIVSAGIDKNAIIWELTPSWQLERAIGDIADPSQLIDRVTSVDFSSDAKLLVTGGGVPSRGGEVKLWNVADGSLVRAIPEPHTDAVNAVAFSPDDRFVASAGADKYVKKFEVATGKQVAQFEGHTNSPLSVSFRAGGQVLASCGADNTIRIWDAVSGDRIRTIEGYAKQVGAVRFVGQTQFIVSASGDSLVRMHNSDNGGVQVNYGGAADYMYCVAATADPTGGFVVAGGHDGVLRIWQANGPVLHTIGSPSAAPEE